MSPRESLRSSITSLTANQLSSSEDGVGDDDVDEMEDQELDWRRRLDMKVGWVYPRVESTRVRRVGTVREAAKLRTAMREAEMRG
jgi:hypothetical protein